MSDRLALIIANSEFDDPKLSRLRTPGRDAEALAQVLEDPAIGGFEVTLLVDEAEPALRRRIARLYHRRRKGDLLLLYYSGHGIRGEHGDLYLATRDTEMDVVSATALSAAFVRGQIDMSGSQRKVVVLDCCHSGAFAGAKAGLGSSAGTEEALAGSGYGRVILTASNAVELAWEGEELPGEAAESVFTRFLVQGLRTGEADLDNDGQISLDELYDYVYEQVVTSGLTKQTPQKWTQKVEGRIVIARSSAPEVSLPGWVTAALASGAYPARLAAVGELAQLSQGQDRALAAAARAELERLSREDQNPAVRGAAAGALGVPPVAVPAKPLPTVEKPEPKPEPELHPSLALRLSVKPQTVDAGGEATWTVTLRNDGDADLSQVMMKRGQALLDEPFDLAAGKGRRFTFTTTYETKGEKSEKVTATGIASSGESVRDEAGAAVQVRPPRSVTSKAKPAPTPRRKPPAKPRPDVLTITSPIHLELVRVPAGEFLMGSDPAKDKEFWGDELPQRPVHIPEFYIGKTPVTNAQYAAFVKATKHRTPKHWKQGQIPSGKENHPVVRVSWHDTVAFCEWLSRETGRSIHLPTEAEWEKAARGTDGRIYPWGNGPPTAKLCNFDDNVGDTVPVGRYSPEGDSPYGCADMAGNVEEWTQSLFELYPYDPADGREDIKAGGWRVVRGGAFFGGRQTVRCVSRVRYDPTYLDWFLGFRPVVTPVASEL